MIASKAKYGPNARRCNEKQNPAGSESLTGS